ncbi:uncharacterized protein BT62DRAFT_169929 [Guyanagaster necrorhizus]|uniref:Uncharacterized protein n=1 Tax=Guyanagaster necrorhizus TaxID=856835 RepID=A0A9P8AS62_9AGAR|nr:uncharacterized protein BT62DRAFT_169929 [Guyanagaster necrorhizus MCA 3950]KAG7445641.1 hypothetical protein BT62DRAFT_169929 [Guyanagaster necrorhizus MCA 3950]
MSQDSDMRAVVKGFSAQLRLRILRAWTTNPTPDDEYAYCRTKGRWTPCSRCVSMESVCVAYNIGCSNCNFSKVVCSRFRDEKYHRIQQFIAMDSTSMPAVVQACLDLHRQDLVPAVVREGLGLSENTLHGHNNSPAETSLSVSLPSFQESFPSHLFPSIDPHAEIETGSTARMVQALRQRNEYLHRENERLKKRLRLEVEDQEPNGTASVS